MTHKAVEAVDTPFTEVGRLLAALGNNETKACLSPLCSLGTSTRAATCVG
jgi:hypothetical protein